MTIYFFTFRLLQQKESALTFFRLYIQKTKTSVYSSQSIIIDQETIYSINTKLYFQYNYDKKLNCIECMVNREHVSTSVDRYKITNENKREEKKKPKKFLKISKPRGSRRRNIRLPFFSMSSCTSISLIQNSAIYSINVNVHMRFVLNDIFLC